MSDVSIDHIRTVVARWFPNQEIALNRAASGVSTPIFRVCVGAEVFWVRTGEQSGEIRDGEVAAHRHLVAGGVPVPAVVRYEGSPSELDRSITLTAHMPGVPFAGCSSGTRTPALAIEIGRVLARLNCLPVLGFGWAYARSKDGIPVGEHDTRSSWSREYRDAVHAIGVSEVLDASTLSSLENIVERWAGEPDGREGRLAHGDFDTSHIFIDPDHHTLTGIIDLGELRGADLLYDLGHLLLHDGECGRPTLFPHILDGYTEVTPLPGDVMELIRRQAVVIGVRALAIQVTRRPSRYRDWLVKRTTSLL